MISVETVPGHVTVRLRIFNERAEAVRITPDTIWLALGYASEPSGPRFPAEGPVPFDLLPGQAADFVLFWTWAGELYGSLNIGAYRYSIEFSQ